MKGTDMKKCNKCHDLKNIEKFSRDKNSDDGHDKYCKKCKSNMSLLYNRTIRGVITRIYSSQKGNSKLRKMESPKYTKNELKEWLLNSEVFLRIYDNWVESKYCKYLKPSVDRINDYKPYSLDNIKICTWKENFDKGNCFRKIGINNKINIAVNQYDLKGNFINTFHSLSEAGRSIGKDNRHIGECCKGKRKTAYRYKWAYA